MGCGWEQKAFCSSGCGLEKTSLSLADTAGAIGPVVVVGFVVSGLEAVDDGWAASSRLAIRRPPRACERLRSPFMMLLVKRSLGELLSGDGLAAGSDNDGEVRRRIKSRSHEVHWFWEVHAQVKHYPSIN